MYEFKCIAVERDGFVSYYMQATDLNTRFTTNALIYGPFEREIVDAADRAVQRQHRDIEDDKPR